MIKYLMRSAALLAVAISLTSGVFAQDQSTTNVKDMVAAARAEVPTITPADAAKLLGNDNVLFLDVRDAPELAANGKVKGAHNVSRGFLEFKADPASPNYDKAFAGEKQIVLYCASGARAALAGQTLKAMGYTNLQNLGAFKDWTAAGGAVEQVKP
jgi:rhodanese-related sulfurtransferase